MFEILSWTRRIILTSNVALVILVAADTICWKQITDDKTRITLRFCICTFFLLQFLAVCGSVWSSRYKMRMELSLLILEVGSMLTSALQICIETEGGKKIGSTAYWCTVMVNILTNSYKGYMDAVASCTDKVFTHRRSEHTHTLHTEDTHEK